MDNHKVKPGSTIRLKDLNPDEDGGFKKKDVGDMLQADIAQLRRLQERLYAEHKQSLLVVLQATDTGGKDGTIEHVCGALNPQGVRVTSFKAPTTVELGHDFLWRVHHVAPEKGMIGIFNRSHYEDVLIVRVHEWVPKAVWRARYEQINQFEKLLADSGTRIVKFFLHISKDEQKERLLDRIHEPDKRWKFNPEDLKERALWDDYQAAYEDAVNHCSTPWAPWYVVPANRKWYRDLVVARVLRETLESMDPQFPEPAGDWNSAAEALAKES